VSIVVVSRVRRRQLKALEKRGDQALT